MSKYPPNPWVPEGFRAVSKGTGWYMFKKLIFGSVFGPKYSQSAGSDLTRLYMYTHIYMSPSPRYKKKKLLLTFPLPHATAVGSSTHRPFPLLTRRSENFASPQHTPSPSQHTVVSSTTFLSRLSHPPSLSLAFTMNREMMMERGIMVSRLTC